MSASVLDASNPKREFMVSFVNDYMSRFDAAADAWEQLVDMTADLFHLYVETRMEDSDAEPWDILEEIDGAYRMAVEHLVEESDLSFDDPMTAAASDVDDEPYCDLCEVTGHSFRTCPARDDEVPS